MKESAGRNIECFVMKLVALILVLLLWAGLGSAHVHRRGERGANGLADDSDDDTNKGEGSPKNHPGNPPNVEHKESHGWLERFLKWYS